jgi:micrococcal nuclease
MRVVALFTVGLSLTTSSCMFTRATSSAGERVIATVVAPVDGDTLTVRLGGRRQDVRLIGVDTPETKHPHKPVECGGPEASAFTASQFPRGTKIEIQRDVEARDRFGRLLAYVFRQHDGLFLNKALLEHGLAAAYPFEPNTLFSIEFAALALTAQRNGVGMWAMCRR